MTKLSDYFEKDPDSREPYTINFDLPAGDGLSSVSWVVAPGLTVYSSGFDINSATIWLEGGVHGSVYVNTAYIGSSGLCKDNKSFSILCINK